MSVSSYLKRPVGKKEGLLSTILLLLLMLFSAAFGFDTFFGIDACYRGLVADYLGDWYVRDCESGTHYNQSLGEAWLWSTLTMILSVIRTRYVLLRACFRIIAFGTIGIQLSYFLTSYIFYNFMREFSTDWNGHAFYLVLLTLWLYFITVVFRQLYHGK